MATSLGCVADVAVALATDALFAASDHLGHLVLLCLFAFVGVHGCDFRPGCSSKSSACCHDRCVLVHALHCNRRTRLAVQRPRVSIHELGLQILRYFLKQCVRV